MIFFIWAIPAWILSGIGALVESDIVSVCVGLIGFVYAFLLLLLVPGVMGQMAAGASFGQALNPANSSRLLMAKLPETVIVAALYIIGLSLAFTFGLVLCGIGIFATVPYAYGVIGHLVGQLYGSAQADAAPKAW